MTKTYYTLVKENGKWKPEKRTGSPMPGNWEFSTLKSAQNQANALNESS